MIFTKKIKVDFNLRRRLNKFISLEKYFADNYYAEILGIGASPLLPEGVGHEAQHSSHRR